MAIYYALINADSKRVCWEERNGNKLMNDYGLDLFVEKRGKRLWATTEARSGLMISEGDLRRTAVEHLRNIVKYFGLEMINGRIDIAVERYGESPLYDKAPMLPILPLKKEETDDD